jgi:hypothetical protein
MPFQAQDTIKAASLLLLDNGNVRFTAAQLVGHLNQGLQQLLADRPDLFSAEVSSHALAAGVRQAIPASAARLLAIEANADGAPCRQADKVSLDAALPGWRQATASTTVKNWMYDERDPLAFEVYPQAAAGAALRLQVAQEATPIAEPGAGQTWANVVGTVPISAAFANALLDWVLYRAFSMDGQHPANAARSTTHYAAYRQALGLEVATTATVAPDARRPGKPAV